MTRRQLLFREGYFLVDGAFQLCDVRVIGSTISEVDSQILPSKDDYVIPLEGSYVLPGLINSHDHLEFNLFRQLGRPPYNNYVEWADDIQNLHKRAIQKVLRIPLKYRLLWGAYKNIFSGVTTVVHHNPYYWQLRFGFPLEVYHPYQWIHSLRLEKRDIGKLLTDDTSTRFIHLAEGIDSLAGTELTELAAMNGLNPRTVIIHGIGLSDEDVAAMSSHGCGLVWCPTSNLYLFGKTAPVEKMIGKIPIALGTDSTLTGSISLFDEMRVARKMKQLDTRCVVDLVTSLPAKMLRLNKGEIRRGTSADFLMFQSNIHDPFETSICLSPKEIWCLWKNGEPIYGDIELANLTTGRRKFTKILTEGRGKFVTGNFPRLGETIKRFAPDLDLPQILPK
jgi:cytosine/adenosine deaminase-related metal-dependent hydrolase